MTDSFFIDFDVILCVAIGKFEHFDDIDSNIDADVAKKIDETNKTNEVDFFMNLNVTFSVKTRKFESFDVLDEIDDVIDFWIWCSRMCSWNLFLKLKFASQCLHVIFEQLTCLICSRSRVIDENWAKHSTHKWYWNEKCETHDEINDFDVNSNEIIKNAYVRFLSKFCIMLKIWSLNHANANSRKHLNNKSNTFCFRYWCWVCWKCCKKFITLLYRSNFKISHISVESNISISTKIDVEFEISMTFCWTSCSINSTRFFVSHLIWHSVNLISRCVCFWIFCSVDWAFFCSWVFLTRSVLRLTRSVFCSISLINSQENLWTNFLLIKIILCQII